MPVPDGATVMIGGFGTAGINPLKNLPSPVFGVTGFRELKPQGVGGFAMNGGFWRIKGHG
jgi:hypothetical protein